MKCMGNIDHQLHTIGGDINDSALWLHSWTNWDVVHI